MGVTLSTASVSSPATVAKRELVSIVEWDQALKKLLADAVASGPLSRKVKAMDAWLAANEWHALAAEREKRRDALKEELRIVENNLFAQANRVARLQQGLSANARQGLEALTRMELTAHVAQVWMIEARKIGETNLIVVAESARNTLNQMVDEEG
jgi:uncharacterized protein (DUF2235 family)